MLDSDLLPFDALPIELVDLPDDWKYVPLGSIVDPGRGITYGIVQPGQDVANGIPIVRVQDIRDGRVDPSQPLRVAHDIAEKYRRTRLLGGELLLSLVGTVGESAVVPDNLAGWNTARAVAVVPVLPEVGARFVHYCIRTHQSQHLIRAWCSETVQATFNLKEAVLLPIPLPPRSERDAIARILGALDDKIELNRRMNHTLEEMTRAIFKSWFVDFDPVVAKSEGRQPYGMNAETAALFPSAFQDSELGPIPMGWRTGTLSELVDVNARTIKTDFPYKTIEYIDISSVTQGHLEGTTHVEIDKAPSRAQRLVAHGDIIWSCVRPNRQSYLLIHYPEPNWVVSTGFAVLTPKKSASFVYLWVTTDEFVDYLTAHAEGSAYPAVRPDSFVQAAVVVPPSESLEAFEKLTRPMLERCGHNERESRTLAAIRDALLPKLLSGEIRVRPVRSEDCSKSPIPL